MKLCKNCVYSKFDITEFLAICNHPEAVATTNVVNGSVFFYSCEYMRNRSFKCGYDSPKLFKSKPPGLFSRIVDRLLKLLGK